MERADVKPVERGGSDPGEASFAVAAGVAIGAAADAEMASDIATEADSQASESAASAAISDAESVVADTAADVAHEAALVAHDAEVFATGVAARAATSLLSLDPMPVVDGTQAIATTAACAITQGAEPSLPWPKEGGYPPSTRAALEPFINAFDEAHARAFMDEPTFAVLVDKAHDHYAALQARNAVPLMFHNPTG